MIRTVKQAIALSAVASAASVACLAGAAPAQANINDCAAGSACLWSDPYYGGDRWQWPNSVNTLPDWINNKASSARNNGRHCRADFYTLAYHAGYALTMQLQDHRDNLRLDLEPDGSTWDNDIMSLLWVC